MKTQQTVACKQRPAGRERVGCVESSRDGQGRRMLTSVVTLLLLLAGGPRRSRAVDAVRPTSFRRGVGSHRVRHRARTTSSPRSPSRSPLPVSTSFHSTSSRASCSRSASQASSGRAIHAPVSRARCPRRLFGIHLLWGAVEFGLQTAITSSRPWLYLLGPLVYATQATPHWTRASFRPFFAAALVLSGYVLLRIAQLGLHGANTPIEVGGQLIDSRPSSVLRRCSSCSAC